MATQLLQLLGLSKGISVLLETPRRILSLQLDLL